MNLRVITKNHAADPEIGFLTKSISKPNGRATAMPTAWELIELEIIHGKTNVRIFNSHAVGMAVARPYGFEIDFVRNSISGSAE